MKVVKTKHDGWECVPEFAEVAEVINCYRGTLFEIEYMQRKLSAKDIIEDLKDLSFRISSACEELQRQGVDEMTFETIKESE